MTAAPRVSAASLLTAKIPGRDEDRTCDLLQAGRSIDRNRILYFAQLQFVERVEVVQSSARLASVNPTRPWLVAVLFRVDGENHFDKRTQFISRYVPMTINQVGYLPLQSDWGNLFSRITNAALQARHNDPQGSPTLRGP